MPGRQLITYTPKAFQGGEQFSSVGRSSAIPLAGQTQDTVTPKVIANAGAQLGKGLIDYGEAHERQQAVTLALDTMQQAEKEYSTFENDYMQKKRRKDAETAPQDFEQWMQSTGAKYGEQLQGNTLAANLFSLQWGRRSIEAVRQGGHYARQQDELWRGEVADGEAATLMQQAAQVDDPAQIAGMRAAYKTKLQEMFPGSDLTATMAKVDQRLASNLIGRAVAQDNFGKASALATQFRAELGDSYDETIQHIKNSSRAAASYYDAQNEKSQRLAAANTARKLITDFGGDSEKAIAHINANSKDEQQRQRTLSAYLTQRNLDDAAAQQIKQEKTINTQRDITSRIDAAGKDVATLNTIIAEADPEYKNFAMAHVEQALGKQRKAVSDPDAWNDAHTGILRGEPYEIVMGRNAGKISDLDSDRLKTLSEDKAAKEAAAKDDLYFNSLFERSRYGKLKGEDKNAAKAQLKQEYFEQSRNSRTLGERQEILFRLLADREVPGWFCTNTVNSIKARSAEAAGENVRFAVPKDVKEKIEKEAKEQGRILKDGDVEKIFVRYHKKWGY